MRSIVPIGIALGIAVACAGPQPSSQELAKKYFKSPDDFEHLRRMIRADAGSRDCFIVGEDVVGGIEDAYWKNLGTWSTSHGRESLTLADALKRQGLSENRYSEYLGLFSRTGSERVTSCRSGEPRQEAEILMYRSGLAISGCSASITWRKEPPIPRGNRGEGDFMEVTPLQSNWYLEYECD